MADAAKVIRGLEFCLKVACQASSGEKCPYIGSECADGCIYEMQSDALKLLKEQEAKPIAYTDNPYTGLPVARCPNCGKFARQFDMAIPDEETHFCPWCGQAVKWDD